MSTQSAIHETAMFMFEPSAETMSRAALTGLQTTRLKQTLDNAYAAVPAYRKKFDAAGVKPADFKSLADLERLPFTLKADLRDHYPFGLFAGPRAAVIRVHASSGTTGKPTVVGYTAGRPRPLGRPDGAFDGMRRRHTRRHRAQCLRLRPVHRRARRALRR